VNDRRTRGLLRSMTSMMDILPGVALLIVGVRQTGSGPVAVSLPSCRVSVRWALLH
jgi:hypothetical protein